MVETLSRDDGAEIKKERGTLVPVSFCDPATWLGILFIYVFLAASRGMWDLSSLIRDQTHAPCGRSTDS